VNFQVCRQCTLKYYVSVNIYWRYLLKIDVIIFAERRILMSVPILGTIYFNKLRIIKIEGNN